MDQVKTPHVPASLYKFRRFCKRDKDALEGGVLWRTSPNEFNDPYDSVLYLEPDRFQMENFATIRELKSAAAQAYGAVRPARINNPIQQREWKSNLEEQLSVDLTQDQIEVLRKATSEATQVLQNEAIQKISDTLRTGYSVVSFAGNVDNILMWSHYADKHKGFCIEYDLSRSPLAQFCYPVFYRSKLTDFTRFMSYPDDLNNLFGFYACMLKSDKWEYEQEWRIIFPTGEVHARAFIGMPKPTAIILGAAVKPKQQAWMTRFCRKNSIRLKRMVKRLDKNRYGLEVSE